MFYSLTRNHSNFLFRFQSLYTQFLLGLFNEAMIDVHLNYLYPMKLGYIEKGPPAVSGMSRSFLTVKKNNKKQQGDFIFIDSIISEKTSRGVYPISQREIPRN